MKHKILNILMVLFLLISLVVYMLNSVNESLKAVVYTITVFLVLLDLAVYVLQFFVLRNRKE